LAVRPPPDDEPPLEAPEELVDELPPPELPDWTEVPPALPLLGRAPLEPPPEGAL